MYKEDASKLETVSNTVEKLYTCLYRLYMYVFINT